MRVFLCCVVFVCGLVSATRPMAPAVLDCNQQDVKCKSRENDEARIKDSEELLNELRSALELIVKLLGSGAGDKQTDLKAAFTTAVADARAQLTFSENLLKSRQQEIDYVAKVLLPSCMQITSSHLQMSRSLQKNVTALMEAIQEMTTDTSVTQTQVLTDLAKLSASVDKMNQIRNAIELSEIASGEASTLVMHKAELLQSRVKSELLPYAPEGSLDFAEDDANEDIALLEAQAQVGFSLRGHLLRLFDEVLEGFKQLQSQMRDHVSNNRDKWNDDIEWLHVQGDQAETESRWFHTAALDMMTHQSRLRQYLRLLTRDQFASLSHHAAIVAHHNLIADTFSHTNKMRNSALPLLQELAHLLEHGDSVDWTPVNAMPCVEDRCGICEGDGQSCVVCGTEAGTVMDVCGECISPTSNEATCGYFCDGKADSGKVLDMCGECGGKDQNCEGCDGVVLSGAFYDRCGVCDGNGKSCEVEKGCESVTCPPTTPKCNSPLRAASNGFKGCCFNPAVDCVSV